MRQIENECVGCEYCINCGAKHTEVVYCDICGNYVCEESKGTYLFDCCWDCEYEANELMQEEHLTQEEAFDLVKEKKNNEYN